MLVIQDIRWSFFIIVFICASFSIFAQDYKRGDTILLPAPLGVDEKWIGKGYEASFIELDSKQLFKPDFKRIPENNYRSRLELQADELRKTATFKALGFSSFESSEQYNRRYALLTVYKIDEVVTYKGQMDPSNMGAKPLFISDIYYGWMLNVVIHGEASRFTDKVALGLEKALLVGVGFEKQVESYKLRSEVFLRGLKSTSEIPPIVVRPEDIQKSFEVGKPQPILVNYTFLRDHSAKAIEWETQRIAEGTYRLAKIDVEVAQKQSDGRNWDLMSPPDVKADISINDEPKVTVGPIKDDFTPDLNPNRKIAVAPGFKLNITFIEHDRSGDDPIGRGSLTYDKLIKGALNQPIELDVDGQIKRASITIQEVN